MLEYLVERENEEMFRTSVRDVDFPDGKTRRIETYRLVWTWFDRTCAYEHAPEKDWILNMTLRWADEKCLSIDEALGDLLNFMVKDAEANGMDHTDDNLMLDIGRQAIERFQKRKQNR